MPVEKCHSVANCMQPLEILIKICKDADQSDVPTTEYLKLGANTDPKKIEKHVAAAVDESFEKIKNDDKQVKELNENNHITSQGTKSTTRHCTCEKPKNKTENELLSQNLPAEENDAITTNSWALVKNSDLQLENSNIPDTEEKLDECPPLFITIEFSRNCCRKISNKSETTQHAFDDFTKFQPAHTSSKENLDLNCNEIKPESEDVPEDKQDSLYATAYDDNSTIRDKEINVGFDDDKSDLGHILQCDEDDGSEEEIFVLKNLTSAQIEAFVTILRKIVCLLNKDLHSKKISLNVVTKPGTYEKQGKIISNEGNKPSDLVITVLLCGKQHQHPENFRTTTGAGHIDKKIEKENSFQNHNSTVLQKSNTGTLQEEAAISNSEPYSKLYETAKSSTSPEDKGFNTDINEDVPALGHVLFCSCEDDDLDKTGVNPEKVFILDNVTSEHINDIISSLKSERKDRISKDKAVYSKSELSPNNKDSQHYQQKQPNMEDSNKVDQENNSVTSRLEKRKRSKKPSNEKKINKKMKGDNDNEIEENVIIDISTDKAAELSNPLEFRIDDIINSPNPKKEKVSKKSKDSGGANKLISNGANGKKDDVKRNKNTVRDKPNDKSKHKTASSLKSSVPNEIDIINNKLDNNKHGTVKPNTTSVPQTTDAGKVGPITNHGNEAVPLIKSNTVPQTIGAGKAGITTNSGNKEVDQLPVLPERYHGAGCVMEVDVLEKHDKDCRYFKFFRTSAIIISIPHDHLSNFDVSNGLYRMHSKDLNISYQTSEL